MDEQGKQLVKLVVAHNKLAERRVLDSLKDLVQLLAHAPPEEFEVFCDLLEGKNKLDEKEENK